ncbi:MAG: sulfotransferase [Gemmatimonadetes bacterium]|nr:sulfotransferase [Gemmatimonadota bacterium]
MSAEAATRAGSAPWPGFPNFFCIGAMRTGSTSLHAYLDQHPDIFMSRQKETDYFVFSGDTSVVPTRGHHRYRAETLDDYRKQFRGWNGETAIGEVSPSYLLYPHVAERIGATVPDARVICCLRDPVERTYSHYSFNRKYDLEEVESFGEALDLETERGAYDGYCFAYTHLSLYDRQLARYFDVFDASRIHVYLFDDFKRDPVGVLQGIFAFLGVDPDFEPDTSVAHNRSGVVGNPLLRRIHALRPLRRWLLRTLPPGPVSRFGRVVMKDLPPIEPQVRERLNRVFHDDLLRLEHRIGRDLSGWRNEGGGA